MGPMWRPVPAGVSRSAGRPLRLVVQLARGTRPGATVASTVSGAGLAPGQDRACTIWTIPPGRPPTRTRAVGADLAAVPPHPGQQCASGAHRRLQRPPPAPGLGPRRPLGSAEPLAIPPAGRVARRDRLGLRPDTLPGVTERCP